MKKYFKQKNKFLFLLFLFFTSMLHAQEKPDEVRISLDVTEERLEDVLKTIEKASGYKFSYTHNNLSLDKLVTLKVKKLELSKVLENLAEKYDIEYIIVGKQIVLRDSEEFKENKKRTISGQVKDYDSGESLPSAVVMVPETSIATITDMEGKFSLDVPSNTFGLEISYIGYENQLIPLGLNNVITIYLKSEVNSINEVVVTALGITKHKKALGYATQEIKSEDMSTVQDVNVANKLAGRVAGMQVNTSSTIGGSTRIVLRGESTLGKGGSSPLIIVDGVPINNDESITNDVDWGSGISDINANDIASINVLKGPAAAALYGSRAGNGAIVITTQSAQKAKKAEFAINSNTTFETMLRYPTDYQYKYGPGVADSYQLLFKPDGTFNLDVFDETWTTIPYDENRLVELWYSPTTGGYRAGDTWNTEKGDIIKVPYVSEGTNNYEEFFITGRTLSNNISANLPGEKVHARFSYTNLNQTGIVPGTDFMRHNVAVNTGGQLTERLKIDVSTNLIASNSDNRPSNASGKNSIAYTLAWTPPGTNMEALKNYWQKGQEGVEQFVWRNGHNNLYFIAHEMRNTQNKRRIFGNAMLQYKLSADLDLMVRYGVDISIEDRERIRPFGTVESNPSYEVQSILRQEGNADFLLSYSKLLTEHLNLDVSFGGNIFKRKHESKWMKAPKLLLPGYPTVNNTSEAHQASQGLYEKQINSVYGLVSLEYKKGWFLNLTARNDWSSTLPTENNANSYFYPSVGLSSLISELVSLPGAISFMKLRGAFAQVGKDTDPYRLENSMYRGTPFNGIVTYGVSGTIANRELKPEISTSYEGGLETYFFDHRLGFNVTYYYSNTKNQVISIPIPITSGYGSKTINAGEIENIGLEIILEITPVRTPAIKWDMSLNYSHNKNKLVALDEGLERYSLGSVSGYGSTELIAEVGRPLFGMFGFRQATVMDENSIHYGRFLYDENGLPVIKDEMEYHGNANPDFLMGFNNTLKYKNFGLNFLLDFRYGGKVYNSISRMMFLGGYSSETVALREEGFLGDGVVQKADGSYKENTTIIPGEAIRLGYSDKHAKITDNFLYEGTYLKLRELSLTYHLPQQFCHQLRINSASVSAIGRNLFVLTEMPNQDPDTYVDGVPGNAGYYYMPTTKSYGLSLNLSF
jgi:TonB-linked SusC/RagA family outer membrane protein